MPTQRVQIIDGLNHIDSSLVISGWVQTIRKHGKIAFIDVRDGSGVMQVGIFQEELLTVVNSLSQQDVIQVAGTVKKREERYINPHIPTGSIEMHATQIEIIAKSAPMPFDMGGKDLPLELPTLLDNRSLTLRHPRVFRIFKVQEALMQGFRDTAQELGCTEVFVPTISATATEGGAEVFNVDYYGHKAYLTQSPQLYKQMMVPVFEKVYTIAHAYRAEPSVTTRHLAEVTQMDCEFGFTNFSELLDLLEHVAKGILQGAQSQVNAQSLEELKITAPTPRLTLQEVQEIIFTQKGRDSRGEKDLSPQDEIDLSEWARKEHSSDLVIVTHFPTKKRAFYTMPDPTNPELSLSYDVLFRGIEIASGSQRVHDYQQLVQVIKERGMNPDDFSMYLMAFKYGMPEEGGFSYGLERMTMKVCGLSNIREASLFPRDMERVDERFSERTTT